MNEKEKLFIDDTPLDIEQFMKEHTEEEIDKMFKEIFGKSVEEVIKNKSKSEEE